MGRRYIGFLFLAICPPTIVSSAPRERPLFRSHTSSAASFDCRKASTEIEKLVCSDSQLSEDDGNLDFSYAQLLRHAAASAHVVIRAEQRSWLQQRNLCRDKDCLIKLYETRQMTIRRELAYWDAILRRSVSHVGQCTGTTIEWIGGRLGNGPPSRDDRPDETGTSVSLANGVGLVSYDLDRAVAVSRIGDPVRVCLVYIPQHCPPHDNRGRIYAVRNLRTGGKWEMPDSEHECGGA